jgi:hypothetical protein
MNMDVNKCLRLVLLIALALAALGFSSAALAQQGGNGGAAPAGATGGRGGRGRGNSQGGPPANGSAPPAGAPTSTASATSAKTVKGRVSGEQFYIISSVDPAKQELLLKEPKEVTLLMKVGDSTQYADETGKPIKLSDLRAGDTVWVTSSGAGEPIAIHIRKGQMTVADLHAHYLDYAAIK